MTTRLMVPLTVLVATSSAAAPLPSLQNGDHKFANSICRGHELSVNDLAAAFGIVQVTLRQPAAAAAGRENQQIQVRVGKVWKAPPTDGSSGELQSKQILEVELMGQDWEADCKRMRKNVSYLLLLDRLQETELESATHWRVVFPPVRFGGKVKKVVKSLFCKASIFQLFLISSLVLNHCCQVPARFMG